MKAIETKYIGATNTRGSRIVATAEGGHRLSISYPMEAQNDNEAHGAAAEALKRKLGWTGRMIGGATKHGMAWVFVEGSPGINPRDNSSLRSKAVDLAAELELDWSPGDLQKFWAKHQRGRGAKELLGTGADSRTVTAALANFASNVGTAKSLRLAGHIAKAQEYERIADKIMRDIEGVKRNPVRAAHARAIGGKTRYQRAGEAIAKMRRRKHIKVRRDMENRIAVQFHAHGIWATARTFPRTAAGTKAARIYSKQLAKRVPHTIRAIATNA